MKERPILFSSPMARAILANAKIQTRRIIREVPNSYHLQWNEGPRAGQPRHIMDWALSGVYQAEEDSGHIPGSYYYSRKGHFYVDVQTDVDDNSHAEIKCPYGVPGDRLWVRETWWHLVQPTQEMIGFDDGTVKLRSGSTVLATPPTIGHGGYGFAWKHRPSIFLPRWASRLTLEITDVRVQRVQGISEEDAVAEGIQVFGATPAEILGAMLATMKPVTRRAFLASALAVALGLADVLIRRRALTNSEAFAILWDRINAKRGYGWQANPWVWAITFKVVSSQKGVI